jgi:EmrB/QacA subfamily drug resistance transporter
MSRLRGNPWAALTVLSLGLFMTLLDLTIVNVALPQLIDDLGASLDEALWVSNAYVLLLAVLLISAGRLGDIVGPRLMFLIGTGLFTAASAVCGVAQSPGVLIGARAAQGIGAALLTPQPLAFVLSLFAPEHRGSAFAVNGISAGVATLAGPIVGGLLVTHLDWRWIFYVNVPIGIASIALTLWLVPDLRPGRRHRLDVRGVVLATAGLTALSFGLIEGQRYDWGQVWSFVSIPLLLVVGIALLGAFVLAQARSQEGEPLVPFALLRDRNYALMTLVGGALHFGLIGFFLPFTLYLQSVEGLSALQAGLVTAPSAVMAMLISPLVGRLVDRGFGREALVSGLLLFAVGIGLLDVASSVDASRWWFLPGMIVSGLGTGLTFIPMIAVAMNGVPPRLAGAASGLLNTSRQLGSVLGGAVIGAVLQSRLAVELRDGAVARAGELPAGERGRFVDAFHGSGGLEVGAGQTGARLGANAPADVVRLAVDVFRHAFVDALRPTLGIAVIVLVLAAGGALAARSARRRAPVVNAGPVPSSASSRTRRGSS